MTEPLRSQSSRRVAVVVAAGVGDSPRGDATVRVANGLALWADFNPPEEHSDWFRVSGDHIQPVQRLDMRSPDGTRVDLYEFWWADLSRFPAAMRSFLAAFVGLFLAFPSIGRTALRDNDRITTNPQPVPRGPWLKRLDFHLLGLLAWLISVPVVVLTAGLLVSAGAVIVAIAAQHASTAVRTIVLCLYGILFVGVGLGLLRRYEKRSGRYPSLGLGILAVLAAVGICSWRLYERGTGGKSVQLALADTVAELVAYPLRSLWLLVLAVALTSTVVLFSRLLFSGNDREERRARTVSAVITLGFGPLGIAMLMAIFSAAVGKAGEKIVTGVTWTGQGGTPLCLAHPDDWVLKACPGRLNGWEFGTRLLAAAIYSLGWAAATAVGAVILLAVAALWNARPWTLPRDGADRQAGSLTRKLEVLESQRTCFLLLLAGAVATYTAGAAWLGLPGIPHPRGTDTTWGAAAAAVLGGAVTTLLVAGRLLGISPSSLAASGAAPGALRAILDKPYDIATFLREPLGYKRLSLGFRTPGVAQADARGLTGTDGARPTEMPRMQMIERYRALLEHLAPQGYDRVVFVAHSQGTILTATLLAEDDVSLPGEVSLMTFGCPLRQLYLKRFPSQYKWVEELRDQSTRRKFVKHVNREWVNVAAAGDPVGRTVFQAPPVPWTEGEHSQPPGSPTLLELLLGKGGHSSYWTSPALYQELSRLILSR